MNSSNKLAFLLGSLALVSLLPGSARAQDTTTATTTAQKPPKDRADKKWIYRWAPEPLTAEIGIYGGIMLPSPKLELFRPRRDRPEQGHREFKRVLPDVGARVGFYPSRFFGMEVEGGFMPTTLDVDDRSMEAVLWTARGHLVAQVGLWSITPFVLAGASAFGVTSSSAAVGDDVDAAFHFGGGVKFYLNRWVSLRVEARDTISAAVGVQEGVSHNVEVLGGIMFTLGRKKSPPPIPDTDGDGILDPDDKCPTTPGVAAYQGCPIPDTDGDGILDPDDACVDEPGVPEYDGCPIPDSDGDGVLDPDDECVDTPGVKEYKGCPIPDTDGDGFLDPDDQCPEEPETRNGFQDADGCPDEIPQEVTKFTGVIEGIFFDLNQATIRSQSRPKLDAAVDILKRYPDLRLEISGHTDDQGNDDYNMDLSLRRADAVKKYMTDAGIESDRIRTRGAGETEPIGTNRTKAGRAQNRRIEFKLLQD